MCVNEIKVNSKKLSFTFLKREKNYDRVVFTSDAQALGEKFL